MLLNDIKEELRRFAECHCLVFKFKEDRDMRHFEPSYYSSNFLTRNGFSICESISYIYTFINPRTGYKRKFEINHTDAINLGDELVRAIKDNVASDLQLVDRIKKPDWMVDVESLYPKQMYITTGRSAGKSALIEQFRNSYVDTDNVTINLDCNGLIDYVRKSRPEPFKVPERILSNDETKAQYKYFSDKWAKTREEFMRPRIEKVIFNKPYTIVLWSDKTKTMVKAVDEAYDEEKGLAMAICKKFLGTNESKGNYFDEFKKWLPKIEGGPVVKEKHEYRKYVTVKEFAELSKVDPSTVRKHCKMGLITGAEKINGKWMIPIKPRDGKMEM